MFLFGKGKTRGDEPAAKQPGLAPTEDMYSSAAANALAAAAASTPVPKASQSTGRCLSGSDILIDLDSLRAAETVSELKVQPITLLKTELKLEQTQQVAVSNAYICYGLKAGHIRALDRNTGGRALFKGHPAAVSDMSFYSPSNNLLASVSRQGDIAVRRLQEAAGSTDDATIDGAMLMSAQMPVSTLPAAADSSFAPVTLAWHPTVPQILAAGAGSHVHLFEVPTAAREGGAAPPVNEPGITYSISSSSSAAVSSVAFTPVGDLLIAGDCAGGVHCWWLEGEEASEAPQFSWQPFDDAASAGDSGVSCVRVLHQAADGSSLLLTGNANNSILKLWAVPAAAAAAAAAAVGASRQPVHLQTITLQASKGKGVVFCHVAVQPELQLVVLADTARQGVYTLHYSLNSSSNDGSNGAAAAAVDVAFDYAAFFSVKQPILSMATIPEAVEEGDEEQQQLLLYCVQTDAIQQYLLSTSLCMAAPGAADAESDLTADASGEADSNAAPAGAAAGGDAAAPAAGGAAGVQDAVVAGAAAGSSSDVPPAAQLPTPTLLAARAAAQKVTKAEASASPAKQASADGGPQEQATAGQQEASQESEASSAPAAAAAGSRQVPLPPMPTFSLMHSAEKVLSASPAAADTPTAAAAAAAAAAGDQLGSPAAKAQPAAARESVLPAGGADMSEGAAGSVAAGVSSADVAALQQQMVQLLQMQERMAAQLQATTQQTVAGVKSELGRSLKGTEASLLKQVEAAIKGAAKKAEDDRRKGAAKERQELEKTMAEQLNQLSANLQRSLSQVVVDTAREQARSAVTATVHSVTPAVSSAVATALQQELAAAAGAGGSLQAVLEQSLAGSLAGPLHEALRTNFEASLIPAFERATRVMFNQVESAFNSWLSDSSKAVSTAQAEAASSLNSALSQLQGVVSSMRTDLADTSRSLSKLASTTASRTAADAGAAAAAAAAGVAAARVSGGGGAAAPVQQDPRVEIGALLANHNLETALVKALNTASLDVLLWTCQQIDPTQVFGSASMGLSQTTLLSLVHQLSANLTSDSDTALKLTWLAEAAPCIDPHDKVTEPHLKGVLTGVMNTLKQLVMSLPQTDALAKKGKVTLHLLNSLLHQ